MLLHPPDHLAIDESRRRGILHLELHSPGVAHDADLEIAVAVENLLGVVGRGAGVQHRERAAPEQRVETALAGVEQLVDLVLGQILETTPRTDAGVDKL